MNLGNQLSPPPWLSSSTYSSSESENLLVLVQYVCWYNIQAGVFSKNWPGTVALVVALPLFVIKKKKNFIYHKLIRQIIRHNGKEVQLTTGSVSGCQLNTS